MEMPDLKELAENNRNRRQTALALALASGILLVFALFAPRPAPVPVVAETPVPPPAPDAFAHVPLKAKAAIVYDLATGETLYAMNADAQLPLASLTKLLTMYAASQALSPEALVTITPTAVAQDGDSGLAAGESFAFADLARFALVASSNDAAEAIAEAAANARSMSGASLLSAAAAAAGLTQTYALNGTGLDESTTLSGGYGSARDVAKLAGALLAEAPALASATIEPSVSVRSQAGMPHSLPNTNQEVGRLPRLLLSKTGFTDLAGGNLVVVFDAGMNHPVAVAVLGSTHDARFTDIDALVAAAQAHFAGTAHL